MRYRIRWSRPTHSFGLRDELWAATSHDGLACWTKQPEEYADTWESRAEAEVERKERCRTLHLSEMGPELWIEVFNPERAAWVVSP